MMLQTDYKCFKIFNRFNFIFHTLIERVLIDYFLIEIVGTKEYRQPEWVTQMEEMREALKGMQV